MAFELKDAVKFVCDVRADDAGRFFGPATDLSLGIGLIVQNIPFVFFQPANSSYQLREGVVLVLTHECDIDQANSKAFNSDVLFAPIAQFSDVFKELQTKKGDEALIKAYLGDLAKSRISQLFYLPPWELWPEGGVVYLNRVYSSHVRVFERETATKSAALSGHGYMRLCEQLSNHLLREKADRLPLSWPPQ